MNRRDAMLERLPPIYQTASGSRLHQLLALFANHLAAWDQDLQRVQRARWIETAFDREDLAKLGALFEIPILPWEPEHLYRARLTATVAARLRGAVTRDVLELVIVSILSGALEALGVKYMDLSGAGAAFRTGAADNQREPAFIEFAPVIRRDPNLAARQGLCQPLAKIELTHRGLHPSPLHAAIRGVQGGRTLSPVLINLTNGQVLVFFGDLPCGHELRIGVNRAGELTASLNGRDVRQQVYTGTGFKPGAPFSPAMPDSTPQPLQLERGANQLWLFPLALYGQKSLDSAVFGMPETGLEQGRFGAKAESPPAGTFFDWSLFEQPPFVSLDLWWVEAQPASFRFEVPAGVVTRNLPAAQDAHQDHLRLFSLLQQTVDLMRPAGVDGRVVPRPLREVQPQQDHGRPLPPVVGRESMGMESRLKALTALFDTSATEGSRFG